MTGNLKNNISRGVHDRLATRDMLITELGDYRGSGGMAIAEYTGQPGTLDQLIQ